MSYRLLIPLAAAGLAGGCHPQLPSTELLAETGQSSPDDRSRSTPPRRTSALDPPAHAPLELTRAPERAMADANLGELIEALSEPTGVFPSDNLVSNETSLLHVAEALRSPALERRAYVGVGPEQNLTYIALMRPEMAYIVDIRRQNMLEHLVLRAAIEPSPTREAFLRRLTSRPRARDQRPLSAEAPMAEIAAAIDADEAESDEIDSTLTATMALMQRLAIPRQPDDQQAARTVIEAFAEDGLDIRYSMEGSRRRYPSLRQLAEATDSSGTKRSFLADHQSYSAVRRLIKANRVVPVVGDFLGESSLRAVADDIRDRGLTLGVFYTSNVEQYLFPTETYARFVENVRAFPIDRESLFVRVWFDQGRTHPRQRRGHRTTTLTMPVEHFLHRWSLRPYRSYWEIATDRGRRRPASR